MKKILFVGGGNMTKAIVAGMIKDDYNPKNISVIDRNLEKCNYLSDKYGVKAYIAFNHEIVSSTEIIVLAVKPQGAEQACTNIKTYLDDNLFPLIVSVMAGITINSIASWVRNDLPIIRSMPNTPSLVQAGATGLFCNDLASQENKQFINRIFSIVGKTAWLDNEDAINSITALSGSGPAYVFLIMEYMQNQAIKMGLDPSISKDFALQTILGAAKLAQSQDEPFSSLREKVTSKGGTTNAAIQSMQENNLEKIFSNAMIACKNRALELSRQFSVTSEKSKEEESLSFISGMRL